MDIAENYYALSTRAVVKALSTDPENGLDKKEVRQRLEKYGKNILEKRKQKSVLLILLEQFYSPIIWILIAAAILAFVFGEFLEAIAVIVVIAVNTFIGFFMELQARRSMDKLRSMTSSKARVIRNNQKTEVNSTDIVPGDILHIESGDVVAADARIISLNNLAVKESALTGESDAIDKNAEDLPEDTGVADRKNSIFKGTIVTRGNGTAVVVSTGDKTELGRIAEMTHTAVKGTTPLNKKLNNLTRKLIWLTLFITLVIFLTGILRGKEWVMMIETAIALAIASIPEGLPVIATIALSRGMLSLAKKNVLVKSLESVQTLGETEVIFTDKTGTLTENEMYVTLLAFHDSEEDLSDEKSIKHLKDNPDFDLLQKVGVLCNNSSYEKKNNKERSSGDPLEIALLRMARLVSGNPVLIQKKYPRIIEIPFDSELKMMGTVNKSDANFLVCVKGATEEVLEKCVSVSVNGKAKDLDDPGKWKKKVDELADKGWRVLSFAYRTSKKKPAENSFIKDLVFLGLVGFIDPPRPGIKKSINECRDAGIRVIMITGDHPGTANAIARETGLVNEGEDPVTIHGKELMNGKISKDQRIKMLNATTYARVDPAQKLDLITLYQQKKMVVAMTGDGVNDAPALKKADIGIAMGIRGTEAAREAADLILKDDAFSSIVAAVKQGRVIFDNIRSFVIYLLSCNLSEILIVATASFFNMPFPLLPLQILFLNMVTDVFPALAIGMNKGEKHIMERKPRKSYEPIISKSYWISIIAYACCLTTGVIAVEIYAAFVLGLEKEVVNNVTFYSLLLAQLWHVFNLPEKSVSFFKNQITQNKFIWYALLLCIVLIIVSYLIPQIKEALSMVPLEPSLMILVVGGSFVPVVLVLLIKRTFNVIR